MFKYSGSQCSFEQMRYTQNYLKKCQVDKQGRVEPEAEDVTVEDVEVGKQVKDGDIMVEEGM